MTAFQSKNFLVSHLYKSDAWNEHIRLDGAERQNTHITTSRFKFTKPSQKFLYNLVISFVNLKLPVTAVFSPDSLNSLLFQESFINIFRLTFWGHSKLFLSTHSIEHESVVLATSKKLFSLQHCNSIKRRPKVC